MVKDDTNKLSKYKRRRLISSLMSTYPEKCDQGEGFRLKNNSDGFSQRLNSIFGGLKDFEQKHDDWCEKQKSFSPSSYFKDEPVVDDNDSSSDAVFKRPVAVAPRKRKQLDVSIPEFRRHPEKWVKYSLADVSGNDMSEMKNKQIAMDFEEEMRKRKASLEVMDESNSESIRYRNPVRKTDFSSDRESCSSNFQNGKFIMPEYVVGKKIQCPKLRSVKGDHIIPNKNKVQLHHLECYEDDAELNEDSSFTTKKYSKGIHPMFKKPHYKNDELKNDNLKKIEDV